jgi:hypothetical protein
MNNNAKKAMKSQKGQGKKSSAAVAYATAQKTLGPKIVMSDRNSRRIIHRELIGTVNGSVAFTAVKYALNPGLVATFPWLSSQADGWEQYRFNSLCFEYVTRTATSTVGSVIMSPDYDPLDPAPTSEAFASSYMDSSENATWVDQKCILNPKAMFPLGPRKYIRTAAVAGDLRTFDVGNFFLCTVEEVGADAIGKLWVEYDVELYVPQLVPSSPTATRLSAYYLHNGAQAIATTVAEPVEVDTTLVDALGFGAGAAGVFTPPAGTYFTTCIVSMADSANEAASVQLQLFKNGAAAVPHNAYQSNLLAAGGALQLSDCGYVVCNGTDTINWQVVGVGAAGALTLQDERTIITFTVV